MNAAGSMTWIISSGTSMLVLYSVPPDSRSQLARDAAAAASTRTRFIKASPTRRFSKVEFGAAGGAGPEHDRRK